MKRERAWKAIAAAVAMLVMATALGGVPLPTLDEVHVRVGDDPAWSDPAFDDGDWARRHWSSVDPQGRLLWVRAHVALPEGFDREAQPLAVYVSALAAYEVWWNGVPLGGSGKPGALPEQEEPGRLDTSHYVPPRLLRDGDNVLALRMSSHHLRRTLAAPFQFFGLEPQGAPDRRIFMGRIPMLVAAGALLLGAGYFAAMFVSNRRDYGSLQLSLLALIVLVQLIVEAARFVPYPYPLQILRLEAILVAATASGLLLTLHVGNRYARGRRGTLLAVAVALMAASALLPGFDAKTTLVIVSALLVVIAAAVMGMRAGLPGARGTGAAAGTVVVLFALDPRGFIDRTYYMAATVFLLLLFAHQVAGLRRTEARRAAAQLRSTRLELELLKRQIQPHFLMNALTAASEWIESAPRTGVRMIEALAGELRALASMSDKTLVPIEEEIALCRRHLEVMGYRHDRAFSLRAERIAPGGRIPPGVLHTLLENALTHNGYRHGAEFTLESGRSAGGRTFYRLRSPIQDEGAASGPGTGHEYVRARLQEAFGEDWSFTSGPSGDEWVDRVEVPASSALEPAEASDAGRRG